MSSENTRELAKRYATEYYGKGVKAEIIDAMSYAIKQDREARGGEKTRCDVCGAENIKPFDNGDGHVRCEECAVKRYRHGKDIAPDDLNARLMALAEIESFDLCHKTNFGWWVETEDKTYFGKTPLEAVEAAIKAVEEKL